jgi:hypothetical protein
MCVDRLPNPRGGREKNTRHPAWGRRWATPAAVDNLAARTAALDPQLDPPKIAITPRLPTLGVTTAQHRPSPTLPGLPGCPQRLSPGSIVLAGLANPEELSR